VTANEPGLDVDYAEHLPLVPRSLLLDITSIPGHGFVAVGERGHIVLSEDGKTWAQAEVVPTRSTLTTVTVSNGRLWAAGHDSVILTSGDFGKSWTLQNFDPDRQQPIMDILFTDESRGLAVGAYDLALVTEDGGKNWDDSSISGEDWHNNGILDLGDGLMMVAGEAGTSYRSEDGGEIWDPLELPYGGSMFGIIEAGDGCVLLYGLRGHVQQSCDFGDDWEELETGTESTITGAVRWQDTLVMVGNSGLVLTREGQGDFRAEYHPGGDDFAAVVATADGRFLMVGEDGIHHWPLDGEANDD